MDTVEQAVRVMLDRVDTEAEISSTRMTPMSRLGSPAVLSMMGTRKSVPPSGMVSPKNRWEKEPMK